MAPWQRELVDSLFGHLKEGCSRRYRVVWLETPRKAGKTTLAAALVLYMLLVDEEHGAEIVICSSSLSRAMNCFDIARQMIENSVAMSSVCTVRNKMISYKNNRVRVVPPTAAVLDGMDVSMAVIDDFQGVAQTDLHDVLKLCTAARKSPIILYLASAGSLNTPAWDLHRYACSVKAGLAKDPDWLVRVFAARPTDDWTDPRIWRSAHPGLGITISESYFRQECVRAMTASGKVDVFRRCFLNIWTAQPASWLDMRKWDRSGRTIDWKEYRGRPCRLGLDLSATKDLTAVAVVFADVDGGYSLMTFAFCPEQAVGRSARRDGVDYRRWVNNGFITPTGGNAVDYSLVLQKIVDLCSVYHVTEVVYDKWCASMLVNSLVEQGIACRGLKQDAASLDPAVREFEKALEDGRLRHDGNPVLRWCTSNVAVEANSTGELRTTKRRSRERIDLTVACLLAVAGHLEERGRSLRAVEVPGQYDETRAE